MPWFKVDDALSMHMKAFAAGNQALGLWVRAGSWSMHQLSDGFIPRGVVAALGGNWDDAAALINAGLWHEAPEGYQFHDWAEYQPTREQVLAERAAAAERKRQSRAKSRKESHRDGGGTAGGSHSSPSRPDPTHGLTDYISQSNDEIRSETVIRELGIDPQRLIAHIREKTGRQVGFVAASGVALTVLARSENVAKPQAYVLAAITRDPQEIRDLLPTPTPKRDSMCGKHPEWPVPCEKCAREAA